MSDTPVLLFLHGVGAGDESDNWKVALEKSLLEVGYPDLSGVRVVAPKYPNALKGVDEKLDLPKITIKKLSGDSAKRARRDVERRTGSLEALLQRSDQGDGWLAANFVQGAALKHSKFEQAQNYITSPKIRAHVLDRVLGRLPAEGKLVVIGHSLGSVIAADLIRRLPPTVRVAGMITLGSPLSHSGFHVDDLRKSLDEPPANIDWWANFWDQFDPVTGHRGISRIFPWALDQRLTGEADLTVHRADRYLSQSRVAKAVGLALFGSQSKALALVESGVDLPLDYPETVSLLALRFAHHQRDELKGERRERFDGALRQVQIATYTAILERNSATGRPMRSSIAALAFDYADPMSVTPTPQRVPHLSKSDGVVPLLSIAAANVLRPFEIDVAEDVQREALKRLTEDMGLGSQLGADVFEALDEARKALKAGGPNWFKWVAIGVGAAAVVAATGGLALAAAPGVFGAAAITSALAAFGPGGMLGGLLTAGTLVSAGSSGLAVGLASSGTSAQAVEAVVLTQLAAALLRKRQGLDQDPATWHGLVETATEVRRQQARLTAFSDDSAPTLKEIGRKLDAINRALETLDKLQLGPNGRDETPKAP